MKKPKDTNPEAEKNLKGFEELLDYFKVSPREKRSGPGPTEGTDFELYNKFVNEQKRQELLSDFFGEKISGEHKTIHTQDLINEQRTNRDRELELLSLEITKEDSHFFLLLERLVDSSFAPNRPAPLP